MIVHPLRYVVRTRTGNMLRRVTRRNSAGNITTEPRRPRDGADSVGQLPRGQYLLTLPRNGDGNEGINRRFGSALRSRGRRIVESLRATPEQPQPRVLRQTDDSLDIKMYSLAEVVLPQDMTNGVRWLSHPLSRGELSAYRVGRT
jgi:hypothetical protein